MFNSNNYLTPVINGEIFLEKPPLFFWLEDISFLLFGVSEWSARFPMAVVAGFGVFMTYFFGRKLVSPKFGLISALILGSNVIYVLLSHIAILDLLLTVTMMVSVYFGIMTLFSQDKENWLNWFGFYLFSSLSALSKGLPGIVIPFAVVFFAYLFSKKFKELFDYKKIAAGMLLMLLILLPWHLLMYKVHGQAFIDMYIIKHHLARFINSEGINRKEPFLFYVPVLLIGCIPYVFTHIVLLINEIRKIIVNFRTGFNFNIYKYFSPDISIGKRFLSINIMSFVLIFLFFSVSSTKLPTYILPAVFPLSYIIGYVFYEYLENNKFQMQLKISNIVTSVLFVLISITAFAGLIISKRNINFGFEITREIKILLLCVLLTFGVYSLFNIISIIKNKSQKYFLASTIIFMMFITMITNVFVFNTIVSFGQSDLIKYAKYSKNNELKLATFNFGYRYSTIFYYGNNVAIQENPDYKWFEDKLNDGYVVILKNKNIVNMPSEIKYEVIEAGKKYTLVKKLSQPVQ